MSAGWIRVASGLRLVAGAAASDAASRAGAATEALARHGAGAAESARVAASRAAAAGGGLSMQSTVGGEAELTPPPLRTPPPPADTRTVDVHRGIIRAGGVAVGNGAAPTGPLSPPPQNAEIAPQASDVSAVTDSENGSPNSLPEAVLESPLPSSFGSGTETETESIDEGGKEARDVPRPSIEAATVADPMGPSVPEEEEEERGLLKEGRPVPSTRIGRAAGFAALGAGLLAGSASEAASRLLSRVLNSGGSDGAKSAAPAGSPVTSDANADRLSATLCRMRGAALKMGQMLSLQDESTLPPSLVRALAKARGSAEAMPRYQLESQLDTELGAGWRGRLVEFEDLPFAAASIGQVHRARLGETDGQGADGIQVAMKVQYPGVAESIDSDLNNLSMLMNISGLAPPGLFLDRVIEVGRSELKAECDYLKEADNQRRFKDLVESDEELYERDMLRVPGIIEGLTTSQIITSELAPGGTIDKVANLDQSERNRIGKAILRLTMRELFVWRFMQTDPNWGNFLYDVGTGATTLIDFGAAREYSKSFVDGYLRIVWANAHRDKQMLMDESHRMGFLTGQENDLMLEAHILSGFTLGEPFATDEPYDFRGSNITERISQHSTAFLQHRLT